jgi:hypothetical protein
VVLCCPFLGARWMCENIKCLLSECWYRLGKVMEYGTKDWEGDLLSINSFLVSMNKNQKVAIQDLDLTKKMSRN